MKTLAYGARDVACYLIGLAITVAIYAGAAYALAFILDAL